MNCNYGEKFSYEIIKKLGVLSQKGNVSKEFNIVSFAGAEPKFDIRSWLVNGDEVRAAKGITLDDDELFLLKDAIDLVYKEDISLPDKRNDFISKSF